MLEILLIIFLVRRMGRNVNAKGRNPIVFQILVAVLWIGGEIGGAIIGGVIAELAGLSPLLIYLFALLGAAAAVGALFIIVHIMSSKDAAPNPPPPAPPSFR